MSSPVTPPKNFSPPAKGASVHVDGRYYFIGDFMNRGYFGDVYGCSDEWGNELVAKVLRSGSAKLNTAASGEAAPMGEDRARVIRSRRLEQTTPAQSLAGLQGQGSA